jgi:hypothetical protein
MSKNNSEPCGARSEAERTRMLGVSYNLINRTHKGFNHGR